jgi:hypothetical protein
MYCRSEAFDLLYSEKLAPYAMIFSNLCVPYQVDFANMHQQMDFEALIFYQFIVEKGFNCCWPYLFIPIIHKSSDPIYLLIKPDISVVLEGI